MNCDTERLILILLGVAVMLASAANIINSFKISELKERISVVEKQEMKGTK